MKHIKKYEGFKPKNNETKINEMVDKVGDIFRVSIIADVESSLIQKYIKKTEQNTQIKLTDKMGLAQIAEELIKFVIKDGMDVEKLPANILTGGNVAQGQGQAQGQIQVQPAQGQAQNINGDVKVETQPLAGTENYEEVAGKENLPV